MSSDGQLRVTFLVNGLGTGGAERSLADMLPIYQASGIDASVVCLARRPEGVHDLVRGLGVPVTVLRNRSWVGRARELAASLDSRPIDLLSTAVFEADILGRIVSRRRRTPVLTALINTSYDPIRLSDPNIRRWKLATIRQVEGLTARRLTTHFHAITEAVKSAAVSSLRIQPDDITVIPRGRDAARLGRRTPSRRLAVRKLFNVEDSTPIVLAVGRHEFQKGHIALVDVVANLRSHFPNLELWIAGRDGAMSREIQEHIRRNGIADSVRLLGHRDDVPNLMVAADVLAFPSLYEGLGGTLLEAMALELPIVASSLPAIREVTGDGATASLVKPSSNTQLANAIRDTLSDPASRSHQTAAGRARFEEKYATERVGEQMVSLMFRVAKGP